MNTRTIVALAGFTAAFAVAAIVTLSSREKSARSNETKTLLFPELKAHLTDASLLTIQRAGGTVVVRKTGDSWGLADKSDFPVDVEPVRKTLLTLSEMETVEAKTKNADAYAKLGVEDVTQPDAKSIQLTLQDAAGKKLAELIVGKNHESKNYGAPGESYVRKPGDTQSWLVKGQLELREKPEEWLQKKILEVKRDRVRACEVRHPSGEVVHAERQAPDQTDYTLAGIPEGKELKYATAANTLASGLEYVNLDDVVPSGTIDFAVEPGPTTTFWCFDGLKIVVQCKEQDGKTYAQFVASYEAPAEPAAPAPDAAAPAATPAKKSPEEVQKEVAELNARHSKWTYVLSTYNRNAFFKRMDELVKDKTPPAPPPGEGGTSNGGASGETLKIPDNLPPEIQEQIRKDLESRGEKTEIVPMPKDGTPPDANKPPER
jgi:hypothetical protein